MADGNGGELTTLSFARSNVTAPELTFDQNALGVLSFLGFGPPGPPFGNPPLGSNLNFEVKFRHPLETDANAADFGFHGVWRQQPELHLFDRDPREFYFTLVRDALAGNVGAWRPELSGPAGPACPTYNPACTPVNNGTLFRLPADVVVPYKRANEICIPPHCGVGGQLFPTFVDIQDVSNPQFFQAYDGTFTSPAKWVGPASDPSGFGSVKAVHVETSQCIAPDGVAVCGGDHACSPPGCSCSDTGGYNGVAVCGAPYAPPDVGTPCRPGLADRVCLAWLGADGGTVSWLDAEFELGTLLGQNGAGAFVRYADLGLWTGTGIPDPPSCAMMGNVTPCGGSCGACPSGQTCFGRAPLHPVGICRPQDAFDCKTTQTCSSGHSCFTYTVEPAAQALADTMGICFPSADCAALASSLPGGGKCTP